MAQRSVIMDAELRSVEVSVPSVEVALRDGLIAHVKTHYGGKFANANIYKPLDDRSLEDLCTLLAISAPIHE